jgi:hypothetical protein
MVWIWEVYYLGDKFRVKADSLKKEAPPEFMHHQALQNFPVIDDGPGSLSAQPASLFMRWSNTREI